MIKTVVHLDTGGSYVETDDGYRWDSKGAKYFAVTIKTTSIEEITYSLLEERVRKKIGVDHDAKILMSYIPLVVEANKQTYIMDDEDVESYLCSMNSEHLRSILHVEVENNIKESGSSFGLNNDGDMNEGDMVLGSGQYNEYNAITLYEEERDGNDVALQIGGGDDDFQGTGGILEVNGNDMIDDATGRVHGMELPCEREEEEVKEREEEEEDHGSQIVEEWNDGTGLELGQEFASKKEAKDIVVITSHKRCFDYDIINSDTWRHVWRCRQRHNQGCQWHIRVARPEEHW